MPGLWALHRCIIECKSNYYSGERKNHCLEPRNRKEDTAIREELLTPRELLPNTPTRL